MNNSNSISGIKSHCDEYLFTQVNDEQNLKILNKFLSILKISEKFQKDFFIHLSDKGLQKLLNSLKDNNAEIRIAAGRVLLELLYNNEVLQNIFCEKFNFNPIGSVICLNWLPKELKENIKIDARVIKDIKSSINVKEKTMKYWMWPSYEKYNDENIPDPEKYLIGFFYSNKNALSNSNTENQKNEERLDTKILTAILENNNLEEEKAAGSGSESSAKIKESISLKENSKSNELIQQNSIQQTPDSSKSVDSTSILAKNGGVSNNHAGDKKVTVIDNYKIREEYKRNHKDKSKSIDTNIQKFNLINAVTASETAESNVSKGNYLQKASNNSAILQPILETTNNKHKVLNKNKK